MSLATTRPISRRIFLKKKKNKQKNEFHCKYMFDVSKKVKWCISRLHPWRQQTINLQMKIFEFCFFFARKTNLPWYCGSHQQLLSIGAGKIRYINLICSSKHLWEMMTPFGNDVDPDVYCKNAIVLGSIVSLFFFVLKRTKKTC